MTLQEIAALTLEETFDVLLPRVLDLSIVPSREQPYSLDLDDTKPFYDRIYWNSNLNAPPEQVFIDELAEYKVELSGYEQARLDEIARVDALKARFDALDSDILSSIGVAGYDSERIVLYNDLDKARIIKLGDTASLDAIEASWAAIKLRYLRESRRKQGASARIICQTVLDIIGGHNIQNGTSGAELDNMTGLYGNILSALQQNRPLKAKSLITAVTPDGVFVTQEMKDEVLAAYTEAGL